MKETPPNPLESGKNEDSKWAEEDKKLTREELNRLRQEFIENKQIITNGVVELVPAEGHSEVRVFVNGEFSGELSPARFRTGEFENLVQESINKQRAKESSVKHVGSGLEIGGNYYSSWKAYFYEERQKRNEQVAENIGKAIQVIEEKYKIDRISKSPFSESTYITLENGVEIRLSDHENPNAADEKPTIRISISFFDREDVLTQLNDIFNELDS